MNILLVDDHEIMMDGIAAILQDHEELEQIRTARSAEEAIEILNKPAKLELLITDYNLPETDGLSLVRRVKKTHPHMKIIVLSMHHETHLVKEILKEGVHGYILKNDSKKELLHAIDEIFKGKIYVSSEINKIMIRSMQFPDENRLLTSREREVLKLISQEKTNKDIAKELYISERTVETHRKNIFRKTQTNSLVGLIKFAYANNLI